MIAGLLLLAAASANKVGAGVTPIQKVLQMMDEMVAKGEKEKHEEQVTFASFATFCKNTIDEKEKSITEAKAEIEQLNADILKAQADQEKLTDEIAVLTENIDAWEKDKANLTEIREEQKEDLEELHRDLVDSIEATARAVETLKAQLPSGFLFLQKVASLKRIPVKAKRTIMAFLSSNEKEDPLSVTAPEAAVYEFQSGGVVEMIEKLEDKFKGELHELETKMIVAGNDFTIQIQELVGQIEQATDESSLKTKIKAERAQDEATAKGDLATTTNDLATDSKYLKDLLVECDQKAKDFENRQMLRKDELVAINKAIEIMSSDEVMGTGEKHLPQFIQLKSSKSSMSMLRSSADSPLRKKLVSFLSQRAKETRSRLLNTLATRAAAGGPFDKVKKMIKDMIVKLMEEATEESEHKGWCDTEMGTNKQTREDKADSVSTLMAESEELTAKISKLSDEIAELSDSIAEIDAAVAEATALRTKEKAKNEVTVEEAKVAQVAVAKALTVLEEFYAGAAQATAFTQSSKPYTGMGGSSTGVLGMLEVIQGDFARLESETSTAVMEADEEYTRFTDDSSQDKAVKSMDLENKNKDKTTAESDLLSTKKDIEATQVELDAALAYYEKLKPSCVDAGLSYDERVRMREEEIESLQESLKILGGEDIA
jgi:chromosome segregation ATPase